MKQACSENARTPPYGVGAAETLDSSDHDRYQLVTTMVIECRSGILASAFP